ncbi:MAG: hypothetical protein E7G59_02430 [Cutibacterium granulosum]|uniref:hypothetical protein n=1 Tax=Cutibacterium granulosum TaxID=33011 RepID=UPI002907F52F|nr:hypothetical protein [Cutibacterium granulosum]MDU3821153.1 hypothetical protein [Cutibacterium granulosum]
MQIDLWSNFGLAVAAVLTALATLVGAIVQSMKTREDIRSMHRQLNHEMKPNHGGSLRDSNDRIEEKLGTISTALDSQETSLHRLEEHQRGMARDIGRLADVDMDLRRDAHDAHTRLDDRLTRLERGTR